MQYWVVATVLLSTFALAHAGNSVVIENSDDLNSNSDAKSAFCGIVKQCDSSSDIAKNISNALLSIQSRIQQLESLNSNQNWPGFGANLNRYSDYKTIANTKPVFWLSGAYFNGFSGDAISQRYGLAPSTDVLGNPVTKVGDVAVTSIRGNLAYVFDRTNSITSSASVSNKFTFVVVYRFPAIPTGSEGRFFTSPNGNKLFAGWFGATQELYIEGWINENAVKTTDTVILIGTNDNGVKNLWTHERQVVLNSNIGANDWGKVVIGRPVQFPNEAAQVNVYEAIVFDKVLDIEQRYNVLSVLKKWYRVD